MTTVASEAVTEVSEETHEREPEVSASSPAPAAEHYLRIEPSRGWQLSRSLDRALTLAALRRALLTHTPDIHHSDQGVQYACGDYIALLRDREVQISMATVGKPEENGYAERLMRTIEEEVELSEYTDFHDAYGSLGRFLDEVYTRKRIHSALGYLTPVEFEAQWLTQQGEVAVQ